MHPVLSSPFLKLLFFYLVHTSHPESRVRHWNAYMLFYEAANEIKKTQDNRKEQDRYYMYMYIDTCTCTHNFVKIKFFLVFPSYK